MKLMNNKKAQGLSLSTIVIAALVLIVLVILIVIFSGRMNLFGESYDSADKEVMDNICMRDGYMCTNPVSDLKSNGCPNNRQVKGTHTTNWIDCSSNQICCK